MSKHEESRRNDLISLTAKSNKATLITGIIAIFFGVFFAIVSSDNTPVSREEAVAYSGYFERYEVSKNYCGIVFQDGSTYELYPHTEAQDFRDEMKALPKGTKLYLLVNPNNDYVAEIRTDTKELLNFEESQKAIDDYDNGYIWIGVFICLAGAFRIIIGILSSTSARKEASRQEERKQAGQSSPLRRVNMEDKARVLLERDYAGYRICYRRVNIINELVVNSYVYDEKKAILEFDHRLTASINGHEIEAGLNGEYSYILFDGTKIAKKKRVI